MNTTQNADYPTQNADYATQVLEQALAVVEGSFYQLRDDELNADKLFQMRVRLLDTADAIAVACRHIEAQQRQLETVNALGDELADLDAND
jgi:hypothetical protein